MSNGQVQFLAFRHYISGNYEMVYLTKGSGQVQTVKMQLFNTIWLGEDRYFGFGYFKDLDAPNPNLFKDLQIQIQTLQSSTSETSVGLWRLLEAIWGRWGGRWGRRGHFLFGALSCVIFHADSNSGLGFNLLGLWRPIKAISWGCWGHYKTLNTFSYATFCAELKSNLRFTSETDICRSLEIARGHLRPRGHIPFASSFYVTFRVESEFGLSFSSLWSLDFGWGHYWGNWGN